MLSKKLFYILILGGLMINFQNCEKDTSFHSPDSEKALDEGDSRTGGTGVSDDGDDGDNGDNGEIEVDIDGDDGDNGDNGDDDIVAQGCSDIEEILEVNVNIESIKDTKNTSYQGPSGANNLFVLAAGLELSPSKDSRSSQIRVLLAETGNAIKVKKIDDTEAVYLLKTPSAQQSGIKINLDDSFQFEEGVNYTLEYDLDPDFQIVQANGKCILKPVFRATSITSLE